MSEASSQLNDERREARSGSPWKIILGATVLVAVLGLAGIGGRMWLYHRAYQEEANAVGALNNKVGVLNQPLTDSEFDAALALCDARDPETRFMALLAATADAIHRNPERKARVEPVAVRMLGDPEASVRARAIQSIGGLRARQHIGLIRPMLQSADARERREAEAAIAKLEAPDELKPSQ